MKRECKKEIKSGRLLFGLEGSHALSLPSSSPSWFPLRKEPVLTPFVKSILWITPDIPT
jgi:hypothetical protein